MSPKAAPLAVAAGTSVQTPLPRGVTIPVTSPVLPPPLRSRSPAIVADARGEDEPPAEWSFDQHVQFFSSMIVSESDHIASPALPPPPPSFAQPQLASETEPFSSATAPPPPPLIDTGLNTIALARALARAYMFLTKNRPPAVPSRPMTPPPTAPPPPPDSFRAGAPTDPTSVPPALPSAAHNSPPTHPTSSRPLGASPGTHPTEDTPSRSPGIALLEFISKMSPSSGVSFAVSAPPALRETVLPTMTPSSTSTTVPPAASPSPMPSASAAVPRLPVPNCRDPSPSSSRAASGPQPAFLHRSPHRSTSRGWNGNNRFFDQPRHPSRNGTGFGLSGDPRSDADLTNLEQMPFIGNIPNDMGDRGNGAPGPSPPRGCSQRRPSRSGALFYLQVRDNYLVRSPMQEARRRQTDRWFARDCETFGLSPAAQGLGSGAMSLDPHGQPGLSPLPPADLTEWSKQTLDNAAYLRADKNRPSHSPSARHDSSANPTMVCPFLVRFNHPQSSPAKTTPITPRNPRRRFR